MKMNQKRFDAIVEAMIVKAFQTEQFETNKFKEHNNTIFKMTMKQIRGIAASESL